MYKIADKIASIGAAVVIIGAWAKITHKSYADAALTVGLFTEAFIFMMYAFLPAPTETPVINQLSTNNVESKLDRIIKAFKTI